MKPDEVQSAFPLSNNTISGEMYKFQIPNADIV